MLYGKQCLLMNTTSFLGPEAFCKRVLGIPQAHRTCCLPLTIHLKKWQLIIPTTQVCSRLHQLCLALEVLVLSTPLRGRKNNVKYTEMLQKWTVNHTNIQYRMPNKPSWYSVSETVFILDIFIGGSRCCTVVRPGCAPPRGVTLAVLPDLSTNRLPLIIMQGRKLTNKYASLFENGIPCKPQGT